MSRLGLKRLACMSLVSLVIGGEVTRADEPETSEKETRLVLRISKEFLRKHAPPTFEESRPVDRFLFGAHVTGQSDTTGRLQITLDPHETEAVFTFRFTGNTTTHTVAVSNPVEVFSSGRTDFELQRQIHFDGLQFREGPITARTNYCSSFDGLCTPRGIRGRIARRRATAAVAEHREESDAIALHDTTEAVVAGFNNQTELLLKQLNRLVPIDKAIAFYLPRTKGWVHHLGSTANYIYASPGPKDAEIPVLPKESLRMRAPIEVWFHGKPEGETARKALETWDFVHNQLDRFRALKTGVQPKVKGVAFSAVGEWWVVKIGEDLADDWMEKIEEKIETQGKQ